VSDESDPTTKVEDCCYTSPWVDVGKCKTGGVQNQKRTVVNCRASTRPTQQVDCCFIGDWEAKGNVPSPYENTTSSLYIENL